MLEKFLSSSHSDRNTIPSRLEEVYHFVDDTHSTSSLLFQNFTLSDVTELLNKLIVHETKLNDRNVQGESFGSVDLLVSLSNHFIRVKENTDCINRAIAKVEVSE